MTIRIGLFRQGSSELLFAFSSAREFCRALPNNGGRHPETWKNDCKKGVTLPLGEKAVYKLVQITADEFLNIASDQSLQSKVALAAFAGAELPDDMIDGLRQCTMCKVRLPNDEFEVDTKKNGVRKRRDQCKGCRQPQKRALEQVKKRKAEELGKFTCSICKKECPVAERLTTQDKCKACEVNRIKERRNGRTPENTVGRTCNTCKKPFDRQHFNWKSFECRYDGKCRDCHNVRQKELRTIRLQNPDAVEKEREMWRNWRRDNPEKVAKMRNNQKVHADKRLRCKKAEVKYRGKIDWDEEDDEAMEELVGQDCVYCGCGNPLGSLNGLDRIDNDLGYFIGNVVTACTTCNTRRGSKTQAEYIDLMLGIHETQQLPDKWKSDSATILAKAAKIYAIHGEAQEAGV